MSNSLISFYSMRSNESNYPKTSPTVLSKAQVFRHECSKVRM